MTESSGEEEVVRKVSIRWADWENQPPRISEYDDDDDEKKKKQVEEEEAKTKEHPVLPLIHSQVRLEALETPVSVSVSAAESESQNTPEESTSAAAAAASAAAATNEKDTLIAHKGIEFERWLSVHPEVIMNYRNKQDPSWENPFRPEGELAKEAEEIVVVLKSGGKLESPSLTPGTSPAPPQSTHKDDPDDVTLPDFNDGATNEDDEEKKKKKKKESNGVKVVEVQHTVIPTPENKVTEVERVVIPDKSGKCCNIL